MNESIFEQLQETPQWQLVLQAYAAVARSAERDGGESSDRDSSQLTQWVPRLDAVDRVESQQLSPIHGKLIALGLLRFQLTRPSGVSYQVSQLGWQALSELETDPGTSADSSECSRAA